MNTPKTFDIDIIKIDECNCFLNVPDYIKHELHEYFTFEVPGYQFTPAFKNGSWDGKLRQFNWVKNTLPVGLISKVILFAKENKYSFRIDDAFRYSKIADEEFETLYESFDLPGWVTREDHQTVMIRTALERKRALILSATGSGKSLIIYSCINAILQKTNKKLVVIVPSISLVSQLSDEFKKYGYIGEINKFSETKEADSNARIYISTYQSLVKQEEKFFNQFEGLFFDEVHLAAAKTIVELMSKTKKIKYKLGTTGTLKDTKCHIMSLEGMFGPVIQVTTTARLIEAGKLAKARVVCLILKHPEEISKQIVKQTYQEEIDYITKCPERNKFLVDFIKKIPRNTLVLFNFIEHGQELAASLNEATDRPVYYIDGSIDGDDRNEMRAILEKETNAILIASIGTTSTGVNIKELHNVVFVHPTKSKIRVLQSIGRILRVTDGKDIATVFDIADDLSYKKKKNTTLEHFIERIHMYQNEEFPIHIKDIKL